MKSRPPIMVTDVDLARLEALVSEMDANSASVRALEEELARAEVVQREDIPASTVTMNSVLHCRDESRGVDYHLKLVYPDAATTDGAVSILAPIGSALLGLSVGQSIEWPLQSGKNVRLTLLAVAYQPEASGDPTL